MPVVSVFGIFSRILSEGKEIFLWLLNYKFTVCKCNCVHLLLFYLPPMSTCTNLTLRVPNFHVIV